MSRRTPLFPELASVVPPVPAAPIVLDPFEVPPIAQPIANPIAPLTSTPTITSTTPLNNNNNDPFGLPVAFSPSTSTSLPSSTSSLVIPTPTTSADPFELTRAAPPVDDFSATPATDVKLPPKIITKAQQRLYEKQLRHQEALRQQHKRARESLFSIDLPARSTASPSPVSPLLPTTSSTATPASPLQQLVSLDITPHPPITTS